ncbi:MAG: YgfZ/GcvT domain-containing protein, partial [Geminicoccaceae bacterium]
MSSSGYVLLPDRGVVSVSGADARSFLQGLISNDIGRVGAERAIYAALLTPQGKFLFDFVLMQHGDALLLDAERSRLDQLLKRLLMYRLRAKVVLDDVSERFLVAAVLGSDVAERLELPGSPGACRALENGSVLIDPRLSALGARALLPAASATETLAALGFAEQAHAAYERARIGLGVPDGSRDLPVEKATLLENGFEELNGVDFKK